LVASDKGLGTAEEVVRRFQTTGIGLFASVSRAVRNSSAALYLFLSRARSEGDGWDFQVGI